MKKIFYSFFILISTASYGNNLENIYRSGGATVGNSKRLIPALISEGYTYSALPLMKEFLVNNRSGLDGGMEKALQQIIEKTGVKPFEVLPEKVLIHSRSSYIKYILAKKSYRDNQLDRALSHLSGIDDDSDIFPFALHLRASIFHLKGDWDQSIENFRNCSKLSKKYISGISEPVKYRQFSMNHDYCVAGVARAHYAKKDFEKADLLYLDIPKVSYIWPEILFEEAWNSYYLKNYNRTHCKIVSYRAPVFDFIFNPEIDVLRAMSYFRMCLYDDAKKEVDKFYFEKLESSKKLRDKIMSLGKNYNRYYETIIQFEDQQSANDDLEFQALKSISKDTTYQEMKRSLTEAILEYRKIQSLRESPLKRELFRGMKEVVGQYKSLIGNYTRGLMVQKYADIYRAFKSMSFIKLEVLAKTKEKLYSNQEETGKKRGDIEYIERNKKQYFWDFNGEFWADELGDYVFALRSEC